MYDEILLVVLINIAGVVARGVKMSVLQLVL